MYPILSRTLTKFLLHAKAIFPLIAAYDYLQLLLLKHGAFGNETYILKTPR